MLVVTANALEIDPVGGCGGDVEGWVQDALSQDVSVLLCCVLLTAVDSGALCALGQGAALAGDVSCCCGSGCCWLC